MKNFARARKCISNPGKSELEKKIYLPFRVDTRGNGTFCSFQEKGMVPCTSLVKESHVLRKQGRDMTDVNTSIYKFKEESNNPIMPKESPLTT